MAHWTEMLDANKHCKSVRYEKNWPCTCNKPVKVIRDGVGYCGIHDPDHQIAMQRKRAEKQNKS